MKSAALFPVLAAVVFAQASDRKLLNEFDELSAKSSALIDMVNAMEQRAVENGDTLSPSIIERRALLQGSLNRAGEAVRDKDMKALQQHLTRARGHLERLSKMI